MGLTSSNSVLLHCDPGHVLLLILLFSCYLIVLCGRCAPEWFEICTNWIFTDLCDFHVSFVFVLMLYSA